MSLESQIFKGVSWMAFFNFFSQVFSWAITIMIARILAPGDYGLMAMSTIITGYAIELSDLGLGNAIIQRLNVTNKELSSVFWFITIITCILAISCFPVSYLTAYIMKENRVIPITQTVSLIFILAGLQIVPSSLLRKEMDFKSIGIIDMNCTIISSLSMFAIAKSGAGVWTLILGFIIRGLLRTIFLFIKAKWRPTLHFSFKESKPFLSFGIMVALGRSVYYVQEKADRFFAGRAWKSNQLGYYTFALELVQIPTDKIVDLVNNVSFPAFSKLQNEQKAFNKLYLNISKVTATIVFPLFLGGFILGEDLIRLILNEKWYPIIPLFNILCLSQIATSLNAINNFVHVAQGRPNWNLFYNSISAIGMSVSFFLAVPYGLHAIVLPWITVYLFLCLGWIYISISKFGITVPAYLKNIMHPVCATAIMAMLLFILHKKIFFMSSSSKFFGYTIFIGLMILGSLLYVGYFWFIDRDFVLSLKKFIKRNPKEEP